MTLYKIRVPEEDRGLKVLIFPNKEESYILLVHKTKYYIQLPSVG